MLKYPPIVVFAFLLSCATASAQVELSQIVSREHVAFDCRAAVMTVGRDGLVYLSNQQSPGFVLRYQRDGSGKYGGTTVYAMGNATANRAGIVATANAHFAHAVNLYDKNLQSLVANGEFLVNDTVGWDAPLGVEAGDVSGDFFGVDQHRNRVVRIDSQGRTVTTYPIYADEKEKKRIRGFRVCEKAQSFYWIGEQHDLRCSDWKGVTRWSYRHPDGLGVCDVDADGRTFVLGPTHEQGAILDSEGKPQGNFKLEFGEQRPASGLHLMSLRVFGDEVLVKRAHPTELFQRFDLKTGKRLNTVSIDHERLQVSYASRVWTSGASLSFQVKFDAGGRPIAPRWRVWAATWGDVDWRELPWKDGKLDIPADMAGLYQLKVTPEIRGLQTGTPSEYLVRDLIEIRAPNSIGTVSILTPDNRVHYARTEPILVTVIARGPEAQRPAKVKVLMMYGESVASEKECTLDAQGRGEAMLPADFLAKEQPGRYFVTANVPGFTVAGQPLVLGLGKEGATDYRVTVHGDYGLTAQYGNLWESRDVLATHMARVKRRRVNQFVDRFGIGMFRPQFEWNHHNAPELAEFTKRLEADPNGVAPEKVRLLPPGLETQAAYGAIGVRQWSILTYMDAGLPLGSGHDRRTPEQYQADVKKVTTLLKPYPSFAGWSWTSNWWIYEPNKVVDAAKWEQYQAALKVANETGKWAPILDEAGEARWNLPTDSRKVFAAALREVAPQLKQADSGPYRNVQVYPPITYRDVDEVDVQFQAEQITVPNWFAHAVDFEKRPGKPAWFHPEIWNDQGTGEQILPTLFQIAMRGGDGIGSSGWVPNWGPQPYDDRSGYPGLASIMRAVGDLFHEHGPRLLKTKKHDRVAIVVSARHIKIDNWRDFSGTYFARLFEAYQSCLYAHRPASIVFVEDLGAEGLKNFQAVLLVGQTVEMEPQLAAVLKQAKEAGVPIFADGSCRAELVADYQPLGVAFDHIEKLHSINNDFAYWQHPALLKENAAALRAKLASTVPAVADCDNPEVMLSERLATDDSGVRYLFAVNNTTTPVEPGNLWRMTLGIATRMPVRTKLGLRDVKDCTIFDLFAAEKATRDAGDRIDCDLRNLPMRVFVIVPNAQADAFAMSIKPKSSAPIATRFGPHVKDIAVSSDTALLTAFNWDTNLYAVDVNSGQIRGRDRVGHYFTFAPQSTGDGFAVQGYDFQSAQGYHLHLLDIRGPRRFALPGLPQRLPHEFISGALFKDRENQFLVGYGANWIAAAGQMGLVVWNREGGENWVRVRTAPADNPEPMLLAALDHDSFVVAQGMTITTYRSFAEGNAHPPQLVLASAGRITRMAASDRNGIFAVLSTTESGRLFVIRNRKVINTIPASGDELAISSDGSRIALTDGEKLKLYDSTGGLLWQFNGDDRVHHPRFSPDGKRIALASESGTAYVLSVEGEVLHERDLLALAVPAWLLEGDLLWATWMGQVVRLDAHYKEKWQTSLTPDPAIEDMRPIALAANTIPTTSLDRWTNCQPARPKAALEAGPPNLLAPNTVAWQLLRTNGQQIELTDMPSKLCDGDLAPPEKPWIDWRDVYPVGSGDTRLTLVIDRFNTNLRVDAVTLVEDPAHPESWLRDVAFEFWNASQEKWELAGRLLSNQATHTHLLPKPVESARFRLVLPRGFVGNVRLGEIQFHGEQLGPSHPDAIANKPTVVLFDENESDLNALKYPDNGFAFSYQDAFRGGKCLSMGADKTANAYYRPPFGHLIPNWDFRIVEQPTKPGEYRWLSFAWKGGAGSRGITLRVGEHHAGGVVLHAGAPTKFEPVLLTHEVATMPPTEWTVVKVDLWKLAGKEMTIRSISLATVGGPASFDRIILGRTEADVSEKND